MRRMEAVNVRRSRPISLALLSLTLAAGAHSEPLFVADKLVLNVYAQPDQSSDKLATLETGDAVESLERSENFIHVRLQDGREGWVGASYLTPQAPAIVRLQELQREQKSAGQGSQNQSAEEFARLQKQNAALQGELAALKRKVAAAPAPTVAQATTTIPPQEPRAAEQPQEDTEQSTVPVTSAAPATVAAWIWASVLALAAALVGYAAGYQTLARRVRQKFGGVKIY
jgi:SH3 domain protein